MSSNVTVVPIARDSFFLLIMIPLGSNSSLVARGASLCLVTIVSFPTAHRELRASPRNPNVETESRSEKSFSLDV